MRIRLTPAVAKLVNQHRKTLTPSAEVNRVLEMHYSPSEPKEISMSTDAFQKLLGNHAAKRFLRTQ